MISRYSISLNGNELSEIDERLLILDVSHQDSGITREQFKVANRDGARLYDEYREKISVAVTFELRIYSISERQSVLQSIVAWAKNGGKLRTNDMDGVYLDCICEQLPSIQSVKKWLDPLTVVFSAYAFPYWQDEDPAIASLTGRNSGGSIDVPGTAKKAYASVAVTSKAGTVTSLTIHVGSTAISLSGISIAKNKTVIVDYDKNRILHITSDGVSLLSKRTGASSDDLYALCGETNEIRVVASSEVTATFTIRGAWL